MNQELTELMKKNQIQPLSLKDVLDSYREIDLSEDEILEGMIWAKRKKLEQIRLEGIKKFEEENRKIQSMKWDFDVIKTFMWKRANDLFKGKFELDEHNEPIFDLFCRYFMGDEMNFVKYAKQMEIENPTIRKGLLIPGVYGSGKTWMMKLFSRQNRCSFEILRAKDISQQFLTSKEKIIPESYLRPFRNNYDETQGNSDCNYPNAEVFNQKLLGLCIDDLGSEEVQNNYGNKKNVIGDIIEGRYAAGYCGVYLHGTTNLTSDELNKFYGGRVSSRLREIFNFIELPGEDRRK